MRAWRVMALGCVLLAPVTAGAQTPVVPGIAERTAKLVRMEGFVPVYWDQAQGKLLLEVGRFDQEFSTRCRCRPAWARTAWLSTAGKSALARSCRSCGLAPACC